MCRKYSKKVIDRIKRSRQIRVPETYKIGIFTECMQHAYTNSLSLALILTLKQNFDLGGYFSLQLIQQRTCVVHASVVHEHKPDARVLQQVIIKSIAVQPLCF